MPKPDRKVVLDAQVLSVLSEELFEAFRQGADGPSQDRELYLRDWGFKLKDISPTVNVHLWLGELDVDVPIFMGRPVAKAILNCKAEFYAEEGHYSTILNHLEQKSRPCVPDSKPRFLLTCAAE